MAPPHVALVGAGRIVRLHAENARAPRLRPAAVADPAPGLDGAPAAAMLRGEV